MFEQGSKLREIEGGAFIGCNSLARLSLPASLCKMTMDSFPPSQTCRIDIESGNPRFEVRDGSVIDWNMHSILRYSGTGSAIIIPAEVETIQGYSFMACGQIQTVSFCGGSKIDCIPTYAFAYSGIKSIVLPLSVETLKSYCFSDCRELIQSPLAPNAQVVRVKDHAFDCCTSLPSIFLPSSLEFVGKSCFEQCNLLLSFTFGSPSHLRELLDLPPALSGFIHIPDSVEVLSFHQPRKRVLRVLAFGSDSRLKEVRPGAHGRDRSHCSFVQVSTGSLKLLLMRLEF
jgi:hypothetical protein